VASSASQRGETPLLGTWLDGVRILHIAHGIAADRYAKVTRVVGVLVAVTAAVVGTVVIVAAYKGVTDRVLYAVAGLSLFVAVLGIAQTVLNFPELTSTHRQAFVQYGVLRRQLEIQAAGDRGGRAGNAELEKANDTWSEIEESSPRVGRLLRFTARRELVRAARRAEAKDED